eukprot:COSAG01_NODE_2106_length_8416_cov_47.839485_3_plen_79_part_00
MVSGGGLANLLRPLRSELGLEAGGCLTQAVADLASSRCCGLAAAQTNRRRAPHRPHHAENGGTMGEREGGGPEHTRVI